MAQSEALRPRFLEIVNNNLDMPRALALVWDVARGNLPAPVRMALILAFDEVLGLRLAEWNPGQEEIPAEVAALIDRRQALE